FVSGLVTSSAVILPLVVTLTSSPFWFLPVRSASTVPLNVSLRLIPEVSERHIVQVPLTPNVPETPLASLLALKSTSTSTTAQRSPLTVSIFVNLAVPLPVAFFALVPRSLANDLGSAFQVSPTWTALSGKISPSRSAKLLSSSRFCCCSVALPFSRVFFHPAFVRSPMTTSPSSASLDLLVSDLLLMVRVFLVSSLVIL